VAKDRLNFEDACKELQISEEELEQLVANGEIACVKEGNELFFKKDVISQYKKTRKTDPTIILTEEDMNILDGMEEIQIGGKPEESAPVVEPVAAPEATEPPAPVELEGMDDIVIEPRSSKDAEATPVASTGTPDETVLNLEGLLDDDGSEGTTPIPGSEARPVDESTDITVEGNVMDETLLDTDTNLLEVGEEEDSFKLDQGAAGDEVLTEPAETALLRGGGARAMQMKRRKSHAPFTISLVLTAIVFLAPLAVTMYTLFTTRGGKIDPKNIDWIYNSYGYVGGIFETIADLF
jgi:hypothetical protein